MSTSASLSLSKHQINNVKQAITDLKSENTEYINTMKRLIDSTQDIHRDNKKLEQGIAIQRDYLLKLREKVSKGVKIVEKRRTINIQATHRMKKYQRQVSKQSRGASFTKIRDEIEKLLNDISKIKKKTNKYRQKVDDEQSTIEKMNKLNELKKDLVKMNQKLTEEAQRLISRVSKLKMQSEIEKQLNELKQRMLKSDEIRKKLESEDPDFQKSNSEIFTHVDEKLKQTVPIFNDLESLFLNSSNPIQDINQSSDTISMICSDLALSEVSRASTKSSSRIDIDSLSIKKSKNNSDSSSSLNLNEQNQSNSIFAKTADNLLSMSRSENDDYLRGESDFPFISKNKINTLSSSILKNKSDSDSEEANSKAKKQKSESLKSKLNPENDKSESENKNNKSILSKSGKNNSKIDSSDPEQENSKSKISRQKSKQNSEQENDDSEPENDLKSKTKSKKSKSNTNKSDLEQENDDSGPENDLKLKTKSKKSKSNINKPNSEQENDDSEPENDIKSKAKSKKSKSNINKSDSEQENNESDLNTESEITDNKAQKPLSTSKKMKKEKSNSNLENPNSKSSKLKSRQNLEPENDESELDSENEKSRIKKNEDSDSENQIESESEPQFSESKNASLRRKKSKSDNQESDQETEKSKSQQQNQESENQETQNKKRRTRIKRPKFNQSIKSDNNESEPQNKKSKSEVDEESKTKSMNSKKSPSSNALNLSNKSADESLYLTSSSQENFLSDSKQNKNENPSLSEQGQSSSKPKRIKKRKTSKQPDLSKTLSEIQKEDDDILNINSNSNNLLAKTQPRINILLSKDQPNKIESDSNLNKKRRRRKRKSDININYSVGEYSSSALPASSINQKENKDEKNDSDYSDSLTFEKDEQGNEKSISSKHKNNDNLNQDEQGNEKSISSKHKNNDNLNQDEDAKLNSSLNIIKPISDVLILTDKNDDSKSDDIVFKKRKINKQNPTQNKKEIDSDSDTYEPCTPVHNKNDSKKHKKKRKQKDNNKTSINNKDNNNNENDDDDFIKSGFKKTINDMLFNNKTDENNNNNSTDTYNDGCETDNDNPAFQKNKGSSKFDIFDSDGKPIFGSIFVNENGTPFNNTKIFDKDGNEINEPLKFDKDGNIESNEDIFDIFKNKINSIIQVNDKGEPTNKKIFDSQGNEIKDATKFVGKKKTKPNENQEKNEKDENNNEEIIEEEEEFSEGTRTNEILNKKFEIFDKKHKKIEKPILIDSKSGKPINTQLFDSNDQQINEAIETHSNGKPKTKVFDSDGNKIHCLISVDENGVPIKPEIFDENGNPIKSLKSLIDKDKKKKKKKKTHRLFDKDNNEIKNILLIDKNGKPLNIPVFDSNGEEVKSSITFTQKLFNSNNDKIDSIVEIDSSGHPTNSPIFDSKGNEFSDLSFLIPKEQNESSASLSENDGEFYHKQKKKKSIIVTLDENRRPINTTLFDSDGNELSVVEFDSNGSPTKQIYNKNKKKVTQIIIKDKDEYEEDIESISSLSSSYSDSNLDDQFRRSKSEIDNIFCDANGNEFKNPIFVDLNNIPYNNIQVYDSQCHLLNSPLKYDSKTGAPQDQIFDFQGLPFSHVVQIGKDGNPTNFTLYNIQMEPVTFPTLKIHRPKREKLQMVDDKENSNIIAFENPDKEEEDKDEKVKPKKSSQTKWTRSILSNVISTRLDQTKLSVSVADANVALIHLEEEIHNLEDEKVFLERKVNSQIELRDKVEKTKNADLDLVFNIFDTFIEPTPTPDRSEYYRDVIIQSETTEEDLINIMNEIESNSKYLADNIVFEQQKKTAVTDFPELEKIYFKLMNKNSKLKHVIDKLESHLNIVNSESMAEYASKETRMRVHFEDSRKEKISTMSLTESSISEGSIQINDLNNRIEDQKMMIEMLKKQIAEQQRKERPDAKKLCLELDGLRSIEKKNRENLKMLEMEQNSIETQALKICELIDERSMTNLQQSIDDYQRQLNDLKDSFARMRRKGVKKANPLTNKYELMGLEERIKEAKKQIADVKRKDSVAVNKIDKRIKILQSYGLRVPSHKRVSNGECV